MGVAFAQRIERVVRLVTSFAAGFVDRCERRLVLKLQNGRDTRRRFRDG